MTQAPQFSMSPEAQQAFLQAFNAYNAGDFAKAAEICRQLEWTMGEHPDVLHLLGSSTAWGGRPDEARAYLTRALELNPASAQAWNDLAFTHTMQGRFAESYAALDKGLAARPDHPGCLRSKATLLQREGRTQEAYDTLRPALDRGLEHPNIVIALAEVAKRVGKQEEAESRLRQMLQNPRLAAGHRASALFQLATLIDSKGNHDEAFDLYRQANQATQGQWDPRMLSAWVTQLIGFFTPERYATLPRASRSSDLPVLIVGFPRSGTTLVEQIIASHPRAFGAGELNAVPAIARELRPDALTTESLDRAQSAYLDVLRNRGAGAARVTDKNPGNYLHLAIASLMLPGGRIIHCTRDPMDTCVSCYFQDFAHRHPYTRDLSHLAQAYKDYLRIIAYARDVLKIPMLEVSYEELVRDQDPQTRRIIDFVGLEWDDRCLHPEETRRVNLTASSDQVQRKVYTSSVARWKRYEKHLGPLREGLGIADS